MDDKKYQILNNDYIIIKHPVTDRNTKLFRVIALCEFENPTFGTIMKYQVGGYIQSSDNLSQEGSAWIAHTSKVFDTARISDDAIVKDNAAVFGNARVAGSSVIGDYARVFESATVIDSKILGKSDVHGQCTVSHGSLLNNGSKVYQNGLVINSTLVDGSMVHGTGKVKDTEMSDVSEVRGQAVVNNCTLGGRAILEEEKVYENESFYSDVELQITIGK